MLQRSFNKEKGGKVSLKDGYVQTGQDRTGQIIGPPSHGMMAIRVSLDATCSSLAGIMANRTVPPESRQGRAKYT